MHELPIFCNRTTSDYDTLLCEYLRNLAVIEWLSVIFILYQLSDSPANGYRRVCFTCLSRNMAAEKILKFKDTMRCPHVFLSRDTGNSRFMQSQRCRNITHDERTDSCFTMLQKCLLAINDCLADPEYGFHTPIDI